MEYAYSGLCHRRAAFAVIQYDFHRVRCTVALQQQLSLGSIDGGRQHTFNMQM